MLTIFERTLSPKYGDYKNLYDVERIKVGSSDLFLYQRDRIIEQRKQQNSSPSETNPKKRTAAQKRKDAAEKKIRDDSKYNIQPELDIDTSRVCNIKSPDIELLRQQYGDIINDQIEIEAQAVEREAMRYQKMVDEVTDLGLASETNPAKKILAKWYKPLKEAIRAKLDSLGSGVICDMLRLISPDKLAVLTLHQTMSSTLKNVNGTPFISLAGDIGEMVQGQINFEILKHGDEGDSFERRYGKVVTLGKMTKIARRNLKEKAKNLSRNTKVSMGKLLVTTLVEIANYQHKIGNDVVKMIPAFELDFPKSTISNFTIKQIRVARPIIDSISYEHVTKETRHVRHFPMVTRPKPWISPDDGGYFLYPTPIMRYSSFEKQMKPLYEHHDQLKVIYEALNALGETRWRINIDVYNIIKQAWDEGGNIADLPNRYDIPIPETQEDRGSGWMKLLKKIQVENYNAHSLRCDLLLKLQVAEKFKDRVVYFPHNMDFRGRVYPIPPHLNHMGSDLCRGLLTFAEGVPLGKRGLYWLKIQLANLYGKDKITFSERVQFADENLDNVFDSVEKPLRGNRWWLNAEDPWQCLACCMEIYRAIKSGDPESYVCHLPIHQDGTCNGLQHYAALGGDEKGAKSVNLLPSDRPQDVYSDVAQLVISRIDQDIKGDIEIAKLLKGKVDRRIIKQTVMTSVYGVTFIGARQQIYNALKDRNVLEEESDRQKASIYLARLTFESLGEMFTGANLIMDWFSECASLVSKQGKNVTWVTPLGLPVSQPYKKPNKKNLTKTAFQTFLADNESSMTIDTSRQRSAFPPNFVHCLDSSHMLLTGLACKKAGITYASVHDSFWTHAATVDEMNVQLRETFVDLYKRPILQYLLDHFKKTTPEIEFPPIPSRGGFDLDQVRDSKYFFN